MIGEKKERTSPSTYPLLGIFAHIRAYAIRPYSWRRKTNTKRHDASPYPQRTKGKYVGAYRIRPPWQRTCQAKEMFRVDSMGKPCSVSEEHFPRREKLARFPRNISPGGKTLLGFRRTFPRAGKPCSVSEEHFPKRENLAALRGNTFTSMKTLLRFAATLLWA